jgi:hypothetical protein
MSRKLVPLVMFALFALAPAWARAGTGATAIGPRVGFSVGPDQLVVGGQMLVPDVAPQLSFDPSLELGFGDHRTVIAANFDLHYHVPVQGTPWQPYFGAGMGVDFVNYDHDRFADTSDTFVGGALIAGAGVPTRSGNQFFSELKLGLGDVADLKLLVGWHFGM